MALNKNEIIVCTDGIHPLLTGGMQRHSRLLIEALAQLPQLQIIVVHPHVGHTVFAHFSNVNEIAVPFNSEGNYLKSCYQYSKLVFEAIAPYKNMLIYSQGLSIWYNAKELGARLIVNPHGLEPWQTSTFRHRLTTAPFRVVESYIFKYASKVVSLGGKLTDILTDLVASDKIAVLHNAVNIPPAFVRSFGKMPLKVLYVGRFVRNKGIENFIEMARQLNAEDYDTKFEYWVAGTGPLYNKLTATATFANIHFTGLADDVKLKELYSTCDFFVFPSLIEGLPTVVLEAMSFGMPVVACNTGATVELVDASNGFLIDAGNAIQLKNALKQLFFMTDEERVQLGINSYRKANERFSWARISMDHYHLFNTFW